MKIPLVVDLFLTAHNASAFIYETKCGGSLWIPDKGKVGNDDIWERAEQQKYKCLHMKENKVKAVWYAITYTWADHLIPGLIFFPGDYNT